MIEEQGRAAQTDECGRVVPERDGALRLDDEDWRAVLAALPPRVSVRARNSARTRAFLDAVLWVAATGRPWVQLPRSAGTWHSVYVWFTRWAHEGLWDRVILALDSRPEKAGPLRRLVSSYLRARVPAGRPC